MLEAAEALKAATPDNATGGTQSKVDQHFGEHPQVLDAIAHAYSVNRLSPKQIASMLRNTTGVVISESSILRWLEKHGLKKGAGAS